MPPERVPEALDYLAHMLPVFSMFALTLLAAAATATLYMRAVSLRDQRHDGEQSTFTCQPVEAADDALAACAMPRDAIDWLIPHQANLRIMDSTAKRLGIAHERVVVTVDRHANTSAASIPLALDEAVRDGRVRAGQHLMLLGVGGGFTWGSALLRWT